MISEPPINCKNKLYYNQSFNIVDAIQLVQKMDIVLRKLADEYSTSTKTEREEGEKISDIVKRHRENLQKYRATAKGRPDTFTYGD